MGFPAAVLSLTVRARRGDGPPTPITACRFLSGQTGPQPRLTIAACALRARLVFGLSHEGKNLS